MNLTNLLSNKKSVILERWFEKILEAYPDGASGFLRNKEKQFANPVGFTASRGLENIFDGLLYETDFDKIYPYIDDIVRVRAVQGFTPSQALAFIFHLKNIIKEELEGEETSAEEMLKLDSRIDALALTSFDIYMKCREKVYELKSNEIKNRTFRLLQMANLVNEVHEE